MDGNYLVFMAKYVMARMMLEASGGCNAPFLRLNSEAE